MHADLCRLALQSDPETFSDPYTDSWILHSSPEQNVNMVLAGIDAAGMVIDRSLSLFITACPG